MKVLNAHHRATPFLPQLKQGVSWIFEDDPSAQKIILDWLKSERSKGYNLVGVLNTSLSWLFLVTPNSVRFITDD